MYERWKMRRKTETRRERYRCENTTTRSHVPRDTRVLHKKRRGQGTRNSNSRFRKRWAVGIHSEVDSGHRARQRERKRNSKKEHPRVTWMQKWGAYDGYSRCVKMIPEAKRPLS